MRWQRGSDGLASAKGGSGGASSMKGRSRCGGEGRRGAASAMWRGRDRAPFIGVGRRWWGGDMVG
jgi:hypothetical protein